jgi:branched-chain amino acid transport system substrate-binding protein
MSSTKQPNAPSNRSASRAGKTGISRRDFINRAAATGALAVAGGIPRAFAETDGVVKIGYISPRSGPFAGFGEGDDYVLGATRKILADGLTSGGKTYKVEILDRDSQSDPARAGQLAKELISSDKVDLMLATSTPEVVNPVADVCEALGTPCVSTVVPWEAWYFGRGGRPGQPSPFKWTYHFSFGVADLAKSYASMWSNGQVPTNKKVGLMFPNDADGNAARMQLGPMLQKAGFDIFDPGPYEDGTSDFSSQIQKYLAAGVEIFTGVPIPPDFANFWRQSAQLGLTKAIKIQTIGKSGLFPSEMEALGDLANNISCLAMWHPAFPYKSAVTGASSQELADDYEKSSGRQWTQILGMNQSLLDVGIELLKAANPKDKSAVAAALPHFKVATLLGTVEWGRLPFANVATTPLIGAQWVATAPGSKHKFDLVLVDNAEDSNVPVSAKLQPYS